MYVLMAAYNEEDSLTSILPAVPSHVNGITTKVIVVSDGSMDRTATVARANGATTIEHASNNGKGAALKTGLAAISAQPFDALVFMDADGQHDPGDLAAITLPVIEGEADMVVGSRYLEDAGRYNTPYNRYAVRCATGSVMRSLLHIDVTDPFSGYRCISRSMASCLELRGNRYESELEMAFCAARNDRTVVEVPIKRIYGPTTTKMGSRFGPLVGRIDVIGRYATTIIREIGKGYMHTSANHAKRGAS